MRRGFTVFIGIIVSMFVILTTNASADESVSGTNEKSSRFSVGAGTYGLVVTNPEPYDNDEFTGEAITIKGIVNEHVALRGSYYQLEHEDFSDITAEGFDVQILAGTNFYRGFNAFVGIGYYDETLELKTTYMGFDIYAEEEFSGGEICGGLEYNWTHIGLEGMINVRDPKGYEDVTGMDHETAVSGNLTLSVRF